MNILKKRWTELEFETKTGVGGKWLVEVVNPNGTVRRPFGDKFRPNLITNAGLDLVLGMQDGNTLPSYSTNDGRQLIPDLIKVAAYGSGSTLPNVSQTQLTSLLAITQTVTQTCSFEFNTTLGYAQYTKIYDFPAVTGNTAINEFGIFCNNNNIATVNILSRVLLPETVNLINGQFLRLTYIFRITVPALISSIPVNVSNGTFDGSGQLRLVGKFKNIFGTMTSSGLPNYNDKEDSDPSGIGKWKMVPSYNRARTTLVYEAGGAGMLTANGADFPAVNASFFPTFVGTGSGSTAFQTQTIGYATTASSYFNGRGFLDITHFFPAANPSSTTSIGGILFTAGTGSSGFATSAHRSGWLWRFNTNQVKDANFALAVNVRNSAAREPII